MADQRNIPSCTVDFPLDFSGEELAEASPSVNMLLKGTCLLGQISDSEAAFQSLFDLAEEIAAVDFGACLRAKDDDPERFDPIAIRNLPHQLPEDSPFEYASRLGRHFGKPALLDPSVDPHFEAYCRSYGAASLLSIPMKRDRETVAVIVFGKRDHAKFSRIDVKLLWTLAMQGEFLLNQADSVQTLSYYSFIDPLTHLNNRRHFDDQIEKEIFRSRRNGKPFSLLLIDMDGFKAYNDKFLHAAGDAALQEFAEVLRDSIREVDTAARLGGDEFSVILAESGSEGARDLARRIIERFRARPLPGIDFARTEHLTVSVGASTFPSDAFDRQDLVNKADRALYDAKRAGGGRVCLFSEIERTGKDQQFVPDVPLNKIFDAARSVVDMDKFLEILLFTAMQGLSASRGSIVVKDNQGTFRIRAAIGFNQDERRFPAGSTVAPGAVTSWVVEHGEPLVVAGREDLPWDQPLQRNGYRTDSFLSLPLRHRDRTLGVLHLTNRKNGLPFTAADLASFDPVVAEIASVLQQGMDFRNSVKNFSTSILQTLGRALEVRFPFLGGHNERVRNISLRLAEKVGLSAASREHLRIAAEIHDIGVIGIPSRIMMKKRKLSPRELEIARKHVVYGAKMMEGVPEIEGARRIVLEHHENFDGSGYPNGLSGNEIDPGARILAVAECYDALTSRRPHRECYSRSDAFGLIGNGSNSLYDPDIVRAFGAVLASLPPDGAGFAN